MPPVGFASIKTCIEDCIAKYGVKYAPVCALLCCLSGDPGNGAKHKEPPPKPPGWPPGLPWPPPPIPTGPDNSAAKIRILKRIISELKDAEELHKRAAADYGKALQKLSSQPPDVSGANVDSARGDVEAKEAAKIDERVKGKEEALDQID